MAIRCPNCKKEYDVTLFEFGRDIACECGNKVSLKHEEIFSQLNEICRRYELKIEEDNLSKIKKAQGGIVAYITHRLSGDRHRDRKSQIQRLDIKAFSRESVPL